MAKSYVNTVKYMIKSSFEVNGVVEKPDIVGAIFGQSEGLLGDEMDLKELQKNGKIGRIEIDSKTVLGKTAGTVMTPSSMDMVQTSILAAAIESVDKVGPCDAHFKTDGIDDTRTNKRDNIKSRAKELLQRMMTEQSPETKEWQEEIRETVRTADIQNYGKEKLPAGPDIDTSNEIIVVEGRADVLNLLRNQIKNAIGMGGSKVHEAIVELSKKKEVTLFIDGDRGGALNAKKFANLGKVEFVARAPDGKEVEELTRKEIVHALSKKISMQDFLDGKLPETESEEDFEKPRFDRDRRDSGYDTDRRSSGSGYDRGRSSGFDRGRRSFDSGYDRGRGSERFDRRPSGIGRDRDSEYGKDSGGYDRPRGFERDSRPRSHSGYDSRPRSFGGYDRRPSGRRDSGYDRDSRGFERDSRPRSHSGYDSRPRSFGGYDRRPQERGPPRFDRRFSEPKEESIPDLKKEVVMTIKPPTDVQLKKISSEMEKIKGKLNAKLFDGRMKELKEVPVKDLVNELKGNDKAKVVILDGIITKRLAEQSEASGVQIVAAVRKGKIEESGKVNFVVV